MMSVYSVHLTSSVVQCPCFLQIGKSSLTQSCVQGPNALLEILLVTSHWNAPLLVQVGLDVHPGSPSLRLDVPTGSGGLNRVVVSPWRQYLSLRSHLFLRLVLSEFSSGNQNGVFLFLPSEHAGLL